MDKDWQLGEFRSGDDRAGTDYPWDVKDLDTQNIDYLRPGDVHYGRIEVNGTDCVALATKIVRFLNGESEPFEKEAG